jgi:hypothetical protein
MEWWTMEPAHVWLLVSVIGHWAIAATIFRDETDPMTNSITPTLHYSNSPTLPKSNPPSHRLRFFEIFPESTRILGCTLVNSPALQRREWERGAESKGAAKPDRPSGRSNLPIQRGR